MRGSVVFTLGGLVERFVLVPTWVNGAGPYQFALDTGSSLTAISTDLAARLGIRSEEVRDVIGVGGPIALSLGQLSSLAVGDVQQGDVEVGIVDLSPLSEAVGARVDGIIGYSYLKDFVVTIDYPRRSLRLE